MSENTVTINNENVDEILNHTSLPVVIDLWAPWCGPCKTLAPVLEMLAKENSHELLISKLNVDEYPELMQRFRVRGIPALIIYKNGQEIARETGTKSLAQLRGWIENQGIALTKKTMPVSTEIAWEWKSFYGDPELQQFYAKRYRELTIEGKVELSYQPFWLEGRGSPAAALVKNDDITIFERQTGLPGSVACLLDLVCPDSENQAVELFSVLDEKSSVDNLAISVIANWLNDNDYWQTNFDDPTINTFRQRWCQAFSAENTNEQQWAELFSQLQKLMNWQEPELHLLTNYFVSLLTQCSPPPSTTDHASWEQIARNVRWTQIQLAQQRLGWTAAERALPDQRLAWFEAQEDASPNQELSTIEIEELSRQWQSEHEDFDIKEQYFNENYMEIIQASNQDLFNRLIHELKMSDFRYL